MSKKLKKHPLEKWADTCAHVGEDDETPTETIVRSSIEDMVTGILSHEEIDEQDEATYNLIIGTSCNILMASALTQGHGHIVRLTKELADDIMATELDEQAYASIAENHRLPWPVFAIDLPSGGDYIALVVTDDDYLVENIGQAIASLAKHPKATLSTTDKLVELMGRMRTLSDGKNLLHYGLVPSQSMLHRQSLALADRFYEELKREGLAAVDKSRQNILADKNTYNRTGLANRLIEIAPYDMHLVDTKMPGIEKIVTEDDETVDVEPILSLVTFVCSENATMQTTYEPGPEPKNRAKQKTRSKATWHECGFEWTEAYREYRRAKSQSRALGGSVRPHIRRAHWHHFWCGPRDGERELVCHWIPPTLVKGKLGTPANAGHVITKRKDA